MAIRIVCTQCGYRNDLGRVFCTQCGRKLDMTRTAMEDLRDRREFDVGKLVKNLLGGLLLAAVVAGVALGFWPATVPPLQIDKAGSVQVPFKTGAIKKAMAAKQKQNVEFTEAELNGYLAVRARSRKLKTLLVDLKPDAFELQTWVTLTTPFTNVTWLKEVQIPMSLGLNGSFEGGRLVVKRAQVGHLPLIGPAATPVRSYFAGIFSDVVAERLVVENLTDVSLSEAAVALRFGK